MEKFRPWLHKALCVGATIDIGLATYSHLTGEILDAIYFMLGTMVMLMMVSMTEDYDD